MDIKKVIEHCKIFNGECKGCAIVSDDRSCPFHSVPENWNIEEIKAGYAKLFPEPINATDKFVKVSTGTTLEELDKLVRNGELYSEYCDIISIDSAHHHDIKEIGGFHKRNQNYIKSVNIYEFATDIGHPVLTRKNKKGYRAEIDTISSDYKDSAEDAAKDLVARIQGIKIAEFTVPENLTV